MNSSFESPEVNNRLWRTFENCSQRYSSNRSIAIYFSYS
jgi:hypothetical protein